MLEGLVATLLNRFLGIYIQNFDPKQLNIGIWSGDVTLRNLELRKDALDQMKLPINVVEGHLGQLTLQIPWSGLKNKPVKIIIEDVFLLAGPKSDADYDDEEEIRRQVRIKLEKLNSAELLKEKTSAGMSEEEQQKNQSFTESLVTKIVDNLQVTVKNIHIRYEDSLSTPGHPFALGFTLEEFSAVSTDEDWMPSFISGHVKNTHKLAKLGALAVYWNTDADLMTNDPGHSSEKLAAFKELIATAERSQDGHQFILKPVSGIGKIEMDKTGQTDVPHIKANLDFEEIGFIIDEDQYRDALMMIDLFHFYIRHQQYKKYQPKNSRPKDDPRAWLKFATDCVLNQVHEKNRKWSWDYFRERRDDRKRYIELFKKTKHPDEPLTVNEQEEYDALEVKLSYEDLRFYRSLARSELRKEKATIKKKVEQPAQKQGWVGWIWGSQPQAEEEVEDETVMTEEQKKELYDAIDWDERKALEESIDVPRDTVKALIEASLKTGSFTLRRDPHGEANDILSILFDNFTSKVAKRPDSFLAEISLGALRVYDGTTEGTLFPQIVKIKKPQDTMKPVRIEEVDEVDEFEDIKEESAEGDEPFFQASFEQNPLDGSADSAFSVKMRSMEIIYNPSFVEGAYRFFKPPERHMESINALIESASATVEGIRQQTRAGLEFALEEHKTINAKLDLQAPLIIIPESCTSKTTHCLVLDAGHISMSSELVSKDDIKEIQNKQSKTYTDEDFEKLENLMYDKFKLQLQSTQLLIGPSIEETLKQLEQKTDSKHLHIIDRINIDFLVQVSILPKAPNLTKFKISGHLPMLQASISDLKYKTLMRLIDVAIPNFDDDEEPSAAVKDRLDVHRPHPLIRGETGQTNHEDLIIEDESDAETEVGDGTKKVAKPSPIQRIFELNFTVDKLQGTLYKARDGGRKDKELAVLIAEDFSLEFYIRPYDMAANVILKSLSVEDLIEANPLPEFKRIVSSLNNTEEQTAPLFKVNYIKVKPESPEFATTHKSIETHVDVKISTINVVVTRKTILTLLDFVMTTFTNPEANNQNQNKITDSDSSDGSEDGQQQNLGEKIQVDITLESIKIILNHDGIRLATLNLTSADVGVLVLPTTLKLSSRIADFNLIDDINQGAAGDSSLRQLVSVQGNELAEFRYETFDPTDEKNFPGYNSSVYLRSGSIKVNFIEEPFRKIIDFAVKFGQMQALFNAARQAALNQANQIQERADQMHFDMLISTPIVVFHRSTPTAGREKDIMTAYLGEFYAKNEFVKINIDGNSISGNNIKTGMRRTRITSEFHYGPQDVEELELLNKLDLGASIMYTEHDQNKGKRPDVEIKSNMSNINIKMTNCQYNFLLDLATSLPGAFATETDSDLDVVEDLPTITVPAKLAVKSEVEKKEKGNAAEASETVAMNPEIEAPSESWVSLTLSFDVPTIGLTLLRSDPDHAVGDLESANLSYAYLNSTNAKVTMLNNGSLEAELLIESFNINDNRKKGSNMFRKVMSSTNTDASQFMASITLSGGLERHLMALCTVDSPRVIFSLDYIFELQKFFMPIGNGEASALELALEESEVTSDMALVPVGASSGRSVPPSSTASSTGSPTTGSPPAPAMTIAFRANIVDAQIILIADPTNTASEAIVLNTKQVLVSQQNALTLQVSKVGMYLCRMDHFETSRLRILDDFDIKGSVNTRNSKNIELTSIIVEVDPLVLRVSLRDILLAMQIATKATEMTQGKQPEPAKEGEHHPDKFDELTRHGSSRTSGRDAANRRTIKSGPRTTRTKSTSKTLEKGKSALGRVGVVKREELMVTVEGVRLVLIGDQYELPMLDCSVKRFVGEVKDWSGAMTAETNLSLLVNIYNFAKSSWEPLIEPWQLSLHMSRNTNPDKMTFDIVSRKMLELTISTQSIALASRAMQYMQNSNGDVLTKPRGTESPYTIKNQTGFELSIWAAGIEDESEAGAGGMAIRLADGEEKPWRFEDWEKMRENLSPEGSSGILGVRLENSIYQPLQHITVTEEGENVYKLEPARDGVNNRILCEVKLGEDSVKHIIFRSPIVVENHTQLPVEMAIVDPDTRRIAKVYKIAPGESQPPPIEAAYRWPIIVRPDQGFGYTWSQDRLEWHDLLRRPSRCVTCRSSNDSGQQPQQQLPPFYFQTHATVPKHPLAKIYPYMRIRLFAPIEIQNLLPHDFKLRVFDKATGKDWTNFLRKGGLSPVHVVELSRLLLLSIAVQGDGAEGDGWGASEFAIINSPNSEFSRETSFAMRDRRGVTLNLKLHFFPIPDSGGAFRVSVYTPYIILNKTGLDLNVKSKATMNSLRSPAVDLRSSRPGEKSMPQMFSYNSDERSNRAVLRVEGAQWSKPQSFEAIGSKAEAILNSNSKDSQIHIGIAVDEAEGKYKLTKIVTLSPRYVLKSSLSETLLVSQPDGGETHELTPGGLLPVISWRSGGRQQLVLRFKGSGHNWTNPFNVAEVGSVHVKIQKQGHSQELLKVEIRQERATVFIKVERENKSWPFTLRNESDQELIFFQANPTSEWEDDEDNDVPGYRPIRYRLPGRSIMRYAWDYPAAKRKELTLSCNGRERQVKLTEIGNMVPWKIPNANGGAVLDINVIADGPTQTLVLTNYRASTSLYKPKEGNSTPRASIDSPSRESFVVQDEDSGTTFSARLTLAGIGISLVNKAPKELAYITFRDLDLTYNESSLYQTVKVLVKWIQIDNQLYGGIFPIVLYPSVVPKTGKEMDVHPSFHASVTRVKDDRYGVLYVKFATMLLQQMTMELDEDFIFALLDFANIPGASWTIPPEDRLYDDTVDLVEPQSEASGQDVYFEFFNIQPMQLDISFMRTDVVNVEDKVWGAKNPIMFLINILTMAVGNVNDAPIRFNALMLENARVSIPLLMAQIQSHYSQRFLSQIHKVVGSADFLGNPVGLFNNISSGVMDIFYEPYQGFIMTDRPQDLGIGIAKGATSFVKKSVFGVSDSISKFTGSISKGLTAATLDKQFQDKRRMSRTRNRPKHALYGVTQGATSFAGSVASGFEGLLRKPVEGADREGALGFFKGVGKGVVGLTTKPVIGIFDLASNVSEGIRNTTTVFDQEGLERVRLTRYIGIDGVVRPYSQREALGQFWLKQLDSGKHFHEEYVAHLELAEQGVVVMITYSRIMLIRAKKLYTEWDVPFRDLKTISKERTGITLNKTGPFIPVRDEEQLGFLFRKIAMAVRVFNSEATAG